MSMEEHVDAGRYELRREFPVELAEGDGRTIEATIVPYNTPAVVADPPDFKAYREEWLPGAFEKQTTAVDRVKVWLNFEHNQGLAGVIGHGVTLEERGTSLHGVFRVHNNSDGDKALELVREGLLTGMSLEAIALRSRTTAAGVTQRLRAHLDGVALCRFPAYKDAQVLAVREEPVAVARAFEPVPGMDEQTVARLAALGVVPLERVKVTRDAWNSTRDRFTDEEYQASCLVDGLLPVLEPDGTVNANALTSAAAAIGSLPGVRRAEKSAAARKLIRYFRLAGIDPPTSVRTLAHS